MSMINRFLSLPLAALLLSGAAPEVPDVVTSEGHLTGARAGSVDRFLGIPYAQAPVGPLRWRAPQPLQAWKGPRAALEVGPDCVQDKAANPPAPGYSNRQSEDCLYLNLWRPAGAQPGPLPVMVWIHGGAFIMGSGSFPTYDGGALAAKGVVVVTINYRLGRFGTFGHPALAAEQAGSPRGNYGLMDQLAALQWVKRNIAAFGGDPGNVTIFGQSAGASSVNFLMASPMARGLFHRAISESGGGNAGLKTLAQLDAEGAKWASVKGVGGGSADALRALPTETVLDAPVLAPAFPVIDGAIVTRPTYSAFKEGDVADVPYLVGANDREENLLRWLPGSDEAMMKRLQPDSDRILADYMVDAPSREVAIGRMWGEAGMTEPARRRARSFAALGRKVWLYRFSYVPEKQRASVPGAGHDAEIQMVFDTPNAASRAAGWTGADAAMANAVSDYWVAFAKTGDPNHAGAAQWPAFTTEADRLMEFGAQGPEVRADFARERLDLLEAADLRAAAAQASKD